MITETTVRLLGISTLLTILIPIVLAVSWTILSKSRVYPLFIGSLIFFIFVMVLESIMHSIVLTTIPVISSNTILYILYGCLAAGIFEEGGRWVAFRYLIRDENKKNAITYGIGHGAVEMILVVGLTLLSTFIFAQSYLTLGVEGMTEGLDTSMIEMVKEMIASIEVYELKDVVLNLIERCSALILHVSCSIFVYFSVRERNLQYLLYAFLFHIFMNIPAGMVQQEIITNLWLAESIIAVIASIIGISALKLYRKKS